MPDQRIHRGPHPEDDRLFAPAALPQLRSAVADLSWLLSRGYATPSSLKLVGDRYGLNERQRIAVMRCSCSDESMALRQSRRVAIDQIAGQPLAIDGYNVLTTVEAALAGGAIIVGRDGCWRDMASMHGTWRRVQETLPAIELAGEVLAAAGAGPVTWYLDSPVSNSGRLRGLIVETAQQRGWDWKAELSLNPDAALVELSDVVATADSVVLDRCGRWVSLAEHIVRERIPSRWLVDLGAT